MLWIALFINLLKLAFSYYNVQKAPHSAWSFADVTFISESSLDVSKVLAETVSRTFVECCTKCDVSQACTGVAYRDGDCFILAENAADDFEAGSGISTDYRVMLYDTEPRPQVSCLWKGSLQNVRPCFYINYLNCTHLKIIVPCISQPRMQYSMQLCRLIYPGIVVIMLHSTLSRRIEKYSLFKSFCLSPRVSPVAKLWMSSLCGLTMKKPTHPQTPQSYLTESSLSSSVLVLWIQLIL